ncbi:hypothetical protein [Burkholderia sp. Ac-20379]|uniref:hypothetical protein n=1 Tax=Burkholderia sp. Ac-20379 TaxID=2703900 RepID=UPI0019816AE7|nr:hypothetical protein [Burkholderia sp. Ac-20379]MBN3728391.1 hypothetical protein [Burkholderia sp. Ac-20379]
MSGRRIGNNYPSGLSYGQPEPGSANGDGNTTRGASATGEASQPSMRGGMYLADLQTLSRPRRPPSIQSPSTSRLARSGPAGTDEPGTTRHAGVTSPPAAPTIFQLLHAGGIPTHTRAEATLEGFSSAETAELTALTGKILDALGPIFPPGHNDLLITKASLPRDFARTVFYGKAADIELNLDAHLGRGKTALDTSALARIAQTLTHEIVLHTRKEFQEYFSAKKISRTGGGMEGHREACTPQAREEYFEASYLVSRQLPAHSRPVFAREWHDEIDSLARDPETNLSLSREERAELQQWIAARYRQLAE